MLRSPSHTLMVSLSNHGGSSEKPSDVSAGRFGYRSSPTASWISPAPVALALGVAFLVALWFGPLPVLAAGSFAAHMVMHMGVVAIAVPLVAYGISRLVPDHVLKLPASLAMVAALFEFLAVWAWHAPALHDVARVNAGMFAAEQASFLLAGVLVWLTAIGVARRDGGRAQLAGVGALLLTSMHMTLLGALLLLAPRPLYACAALCSPAANLTPLGDQQLGGVIMLIVGGLVFLAGGLALLASVLGERFEPVRGGERAR
nr:cytochrome c oxidase assembly protein [Jiella sp. LLJ827]